MKDPEFRAEFERASCEIRAIDAIVNELDSLRTRGAGFEPRPATLKILVELRCGRRKILGDVP
jgi:hypothetical protein